MNTTTLYAIALSLILGSTYAFSEPGGEGNNTNCNGQGNPNSPCEGNSGGGGGAGGGGGNGGEGGAGGNQEQTQTQEITNEVYQGTYVGVESDSNSNSESSSNSSSNSSASGGSVRNSNYIQGGGSDASSTASGGNATGGDGGDASATGGSSSVGNTTAASYGSTAHTGASTSNVGDVTSNVGDTTATAGDSTAVSEGGKSEASSGGNTQDLTVEGDTDNSVLIYEGSEVASASAASVFAGYCQTGASAQMQSGGFSVVNPEAFCNNIRMAGVYQEAYLWEMSHGKAQCAEEADGVWVDDQYQDVCVNEAASEYYAQYTYHLQEAHELLAKTEDIALVDAWAGYLIRPLAILALLILL
jgi:hypothetical protein